MDAHRFDSFARNLARCTTRRQVLRVIAAGFLAGRLPRSARAAAFQGQAGPCANGLTDCGGQCVIVRGDPLNCGGCGLACVAGESCVDGGCLLLEPPGEVPAVPAGCGEGLTECNGQCFVLDGGDPANCGGCGLACGSGGSCFNGVCVVPEVVVPEPDGCGEGVPSCDGVCTDLTTDPFNCGGCNIGCGLNEFCRGGVCVLTEPEGCEPGFTDCDGACVNTNVVRFHGGGCGITCVPGELCIDGACVLGEAPEGCGEGVPSCDGVCTDLLTDPLNCGNCGVVCLVAEVCIDGVCVPPAVAGCDAGLTDCGGVCVDLSADEANCGSCGFVCALNARCTNGECLCPDTWGYCEAVGACYDFATDPDNCGGCGIVCAANEGCEASGCAAARPRRTPTRTAPKELLGWPFDPRAGQWAIVNGYRGTGQHAVTADGPPNAARFALDFARCVNDGVDEARGICATGGGDLFSREGGELGWDREATRGGTVLAPVDGTIAIVGELTPTCRYVGIDVAARPGYQVLLVNVEGAPTEGKVKRGEPIGTVATGSCGEEGDADYLLMVLFRRMNGDEPDPNAVAEGVPFADDWEIDGCAYPDDKRSVNQYLGELVPCRPASAGESRANA